LTVAILFILMGHS